MASAVGGCVGADFEAAYIANILNVPVCVRVLVDQRRYVVPNRAWRLMPPLPYLERNWQLVQHAGGAAGRAVVDGRAATQRDMGNRALRATGWRASAVG